MRLFDRSLPAIAALLLLVACNRTPPPPNPATEAAAATTAEAAAAIRTIEAGWNADWAARDAGRLVAHYAPDAILMPPNAPPAQGTRAIAEAIHTALADPAFAMSFTSDDVEIAASGDLAWTTGTWTEHATSPSTHRVEITTGRYMTGYRRINGAWLAVHDINTPEPAMPPF